MARVTIIMSVHGTGQWLPDALASIPWELEPEVIVTANGFEEFDAVLEAAGGYQITTPLRPTTIPLSDSLNAMLSAASGDYVMRLDPDDKLPPGVLTEMLDVADATPKPALVYGGFVDFGARARVVRPLDATIETLRNANPGGYNVLVDADLARSIGGYQEVGYEDWHYLARLVLAGAHWVRMERPTLLHRVRNDGRFADFSRTHADRLRAIREVLA